MNQPNPNRSQLEKHYPNAAVWLTNKRCDGYDVEGIRIQDIADCYDKGVDPEIIYKPKKKIIQK